MTMTRDQALEAIIWSADIPNPDEILAVADRMVGLRNIKIDRMFVDDFGWEIFGALRERGLNVFDDAKISEIPEKLAGDAAVHIRKGQPWMLNCMADGGLSSMVWDDPDHTKLDGLKRFAEVCRNGGVRSCMVTVLTSKKPLTIKREFNDRTGIGQVLFYVEMARLAGFTDIVCSPQEVEAIRQESAFDKLDLNTPGIRPAGSSQDDQARIATPKGAIDSGANRLVIGRPLTNGDPAENLENIVAELTAA